MSSLLIAPLRAYDAPLLDDIRPQLYVDIQRIIEPLFPPGRLNYWKANFVDELSDELIDVLIDAITRVPSPYTLIAIEPMGTRLAVVAQSRLHPFVSEDGVTPLKAAGAGDWWL
jgi:hypothetical protein